MRYTRLLLLMIIAIAFCSCDGGLAPLPPSLKTQLMGRIIYKGGTSSWPPADSVKDIRVVCFKNFPPTDIVTEVLSGNAFYTPSALKFFADTTDFAIDVPNPPVDIKYIAVAWQFGGLMDWKAIGVYNITGNPADNASLHFDKGQTHFITINVDFKNLPPQPFTK